MRITEKQIKKYIHQSNLIEVYDDADMDAQGLVAWRYLQQFRLGDLSHYDVQKLQKIITLTQTDMQPNWRGYYRNIGVWIGGRKGMESSKIPYAMDTWIKTLKLYVPKTAHIEFEKIHPFVDGNGRTGRMLMWWHELETDRKPTLIMADKRQDYYRWFK